MSELLQLLTLAKDGELSTRIDNLVTIAKAHDAEIQQLRDQLNHLIDAHNGAMATASWSSLVMGIVWTVLAIAGVWAIIEGRKIEKRIKALESARE